VSKALSPSSCARRSNPLPAKFIGADQRNDVALVKIDPRERHLVALSLEIPARFKSAQKVLAIGNPFGFQSTLTTA